MDTRALDWIITIVVALAVILSFILMGYKHGSGRTMLGAAFVANGLCGLIRRRILVGNRADLFQGLPAVVISLLFVGAGIVVMY